MIILIIKMKCSFCHEHGPKKKSESLTQFEPSQITVTGRSWVQILLDTQIFLSPTLMTNWTFSSLSIIHWARNFPSFSIYYYDACYQYSSLFFFFSVLKLKSESSVHKWMLLLQTNLIILHNNIKDWIAFDIFSNFLSIPYMWSPMKLKGDTVLTDSCTTKPSFKTNFKIFTSFFV